MKKFAKRLFTVLIIIYILFAIKESMARTVINGNTDIKGAARIDYNG